MAGKKPPPEPISREAMAIADLMGWDYDLTDKLGGGVLANSVLRDLRKAGWALIPVPKDYDE